MNDYHLSDLSSTNDRYKIYTLLCTPDTLTDRITDIQSKNISTINIGKELASFVDKIENYRFLNIDVYDFTRKLLDKHKSKVNGVGNDIVAIYNLGILMEPALELTATKLLTEFSKSSTLIIIWENQSETPDRLTWSTQSKNIFLDFSEAKLKNLDYAI